MKALSLWQPWASLVALGVKEIETRHWSTSYRGPLAIHAAKRCESDPVGDFKATKDNPRGSPPAYLLRGPIEWPYRLPLGAVVATCTLVDVRRFDSSEWGTACWEGILGERIPDEQLPYGDFTPGRFGWVLTDIKRIEPIAAVGHQGLFEWPGQGDHAAE